MISWTWIWTGYFAKAVKERQVRADHHLLQHLEQIVARAGIYSRDGRRWEDFLMYLFQYHPLHVHRAHVYVIKYVSSNTLRCQYVFKHIIYYHSVAF